MASIASFLLGQMNQMNDLFDVQYLDKTKELINRRMNQILVTSYLYEVKNAPTGISDYEWDKRAKELVKLIKDNREIAKELPYYKAFENWTGDSASSLIAYFDYTIECRAKLHYFCTYGKELED